MHQLKIFDYQLENIYHFHLSIPWINPWKDDILTYLLYIYQGINFFSQLKGKQKLQPSQAQQKTFSSSIRRSRRVPRKLMASTNTIILINLNDMY
jgi:hypothetical protein